jgi:hypothetical protein
VKSKRRTAMPWLASAWAMRLAAKIILAAREAMSKQSVGGELTRWAIECRS